VIGAGALLLADAEPEGVYIGAATERSKVPSTRLRRYDACAGKSSACSTARRRSTPSQAEVARGQSAAGALEGDVYRVFFSGRDDLKRSSVGAADIDIVKRRVVKEHCGARFSSTGLRAASTPTV
jgi:hypothetical protein